jgi:hypothetical protein
MIPHWSFSSLKLLNSCPRQWWYKYIAGEQQPAGDAAQFGSAFDQRVSKKLGIEPGKEDKPVELNSEAEAQMQEALTYYFAQPQAWQTADRAQSKVEMTPAVWAELADIHGAQGELKRPFIGYIDLLRHQGMERQVLDLKTSSRNDYRPEWSLQTALYALAEHASECHIHLLIRGKKELRFAAYRFRPLSSTYAWAISVVSYWADQGERVMRVDSPLEVAATPGYHCDWCPRALDCEGARLMKVEVY